MMPNPGVGAPLVARLYDRSQAARWGLSTEMFRVALEASVAHAFAGGRATPAEVERHVGALHIEDLALAAACAAGQEIAWEFFVSTCRPALYRAADAIDSTGGARDLADALYADLFGWRERQGARQSLLRYFHGRSSLTTWLRAVLAQRHVDSLRERRRLDPLPEDIAATPSSGDAANPERSRHLAAMASALAVVVSGLAPRDRLRLRCYYSQDMTLAAIGRLLGEHEATVSRHLTRIRHAIREGVEAHLRDQHGFDEPTLAECFRSVVDDPGPLDLAAMLGRPDRKNHGQDRSR